MKLLYSLIGLSCVFLLVAIGYLIISRPPSSSQEKVLSQPLSKFAEYYDKYKNADITTGLFIKFKGRVKTVHTNAVEIISNNIDVTLSNPYTELLFFASDKSKNSVLKIKSSDIKVGDQVEVETNVDINTGQLVANIVRKIN